MYVDSLGTGIDTGAQQRLQDFKENITSKLNEDNLLTLRVPWLEGGLDPFTHPEHQEYLETVHNSVLNWCKDKLYQCIAEQTAFKLWNSNAHSFTHEMFSHYHLYHHLTTKQGHKTFKDLHDKLMKGFEKGQKDNHHSILIFGREGSGKSTLVTQLCTSYVETMGKSVITLLRYINQQTLSYTVSDLLFSLNLQLSEILDQNKAELRLMKVDELAEQLVKSLEALSRRGWTVMVVLDGIENLKPDSPGSDFTVDWLPFKLAANIHILLTCSNTNKSLIQRVKARAPDKDLWGETSSIDLKDSVALVNGILSSMGEPTVPQDKEKTCYKMCKAEPTPLFVSLLAMDISWTEDVWTNGSSATCLEDVLHNVFNEAEERFGSTIIGAITRYITSGYHGVTEMELLDLLSANNDVMLLIYPFDIPPVVRFPLWLWLCIRDFLSKSIQSRTVSSSNWTFN